MSASDEKQQICAELTLLVGQQQEGHLACKKTGRGMVEVGAG